MPKARKKLKKKDPDLGGHGMFVFNPERFFPDRHLRGMYNYFNKKWFNFQLPYMQCGYYKHKEKSNQTGEYASTVRFPQARFPYYILINNRFKGLAKTIEASMLHEMVHVQMYVENPKEKTIYHGKKFQKAKRALILKGAFDELL